MLGKCLNIRWVDSQYLFIDSKLAITGKKTRQSVKMAPKEGDCLMSKLTRYSAASKGKVIKEGIKSKETQAQMASLFEAHHTQISGWK